MSRPAEHRVAIFTSATVAAAAEELDRLSRDGFRVEVRPSGEHLWLIASRPTPAAPPPMADVEFNGIVLLVSKHFGVLRQEILAKRRRYGDEVFAARQAAMYFARELLKESYPQVARRFGCHHASVIDACRRAEGFIAICQPRYIAVMKELSLHSMKEGIE